MNNSEAKLARHVKPRRPFRVQRSKLRNEVEIADLKGHRAPVARDRRIEHDSKAFPSS